MNALHITPSPIACALAAAALLCAATAAHAASEDEQAHACRSDALHFCMADVPDKARITQCMKQHYDELSPGCKAMFDKPQKHPRSNRS
jgi:Spy/CpxP family protein refolding chaperone